MYIQERLSQFSDGKDEMQKRYHVNLLKLRINLAFSTNSNPYNFDLDDDLESLLNTKTDKFLENFVRMIDYKKGSAAEQKTEPVRIPTAEDKEIDAWWREYNELRNPRTEAV